MNHKIYSPNMLKTYEKCSQLFYLKHVKNITMPANDDIFEFGKNIHALATYYLRKENIDKLEQSLSSLELECWKHLKNIDYFSYEYVNSEYNLTFKYKDVFLGGRLDALVKNDNTYYILDYKTGAIPKNPQMDFQTIVYLMAVRAFFKTNNVVFVYIDLKNKTDIKIELSDKLLTEYELKLNDIITKIKTESYSKKSNDCNCEYNVICY